MSRPRTTPEQFDPIFCHGVPIVGGHAVNLWASYYAPRGDPELLRFQPFLSKDGDIFLKDRAVAQAIATAAGWKFVRNDEVRASLIGKITMEKDGVSLEVDVLRTVTGLTDADLAKTERLTLKGGAAYCLPAPQIMLKAKLANLEAFDQDIPDHERQDSRHVRMLAVCSRHYLQDSVQALRLGKMDEREAVERFMTTHRVITSPVARGLDNLWDLDLDAAIPARNELGSLTDLPKIDAFYRYQIERVDLHERDRNVATDLGREKGKDREIEL